MELSLVFPTYNERENLALLCRRVTEVLRGFSYEIIVVDDDSRWDMAGGRAPAGELPPSCASCAEWGTEA